MVKINLIFDRRNFCAYTLLSLITFCLFCFFFDDTIYGQNDSESYQEISTNNQEFLRYESFNLGIEIGYPTNWEVETVDDERSILFRSPYEGPNDLAREYLKIYTLPISNMTLDNIISVKEPLQNLIIVEPPYTAFLANASGRALTYTYMDHTYGEIKAMKFATQKGDKAYLMIFQAQATKFDKYLPLIKKMINSLETFSLLQYVNFDKGITLTHPSNWNRTDVNNNTVIFSSLDENKITPESIINISSYPANETASFIKAINETIDNYEKVFPDFLLDNSASSLSSGKITSRYNLNFSFSYDNFNTVNASDIISIDNGKVIHILYYTLSNNPLKHSTLKDIIKSIHPFAIKRYENIFFNNTGIILQYPVLQYPAEWPWEPDKWPWEPQINGNSLSLIKESFLGMPNFTLAVIPSTENKSIHNLTKLNTGNPVTTNEILIKSNFGRNITAQIFNSWNYSNDHQNITTLKVNAKDSRGNVYSLTYTGERSFYNLYLPFTKEIISSLKLIEPIIYNKTDFNSSQAPPISNFKYPNNWTLSLLKPGFQIFSPLENDSDPADTFYEYLSMNVQPAGISEISDLISSDINYLKGNWTKFQLIESNETTLSNKPAHKIKFTYFDYTCQCDVEAMSIYTIIGPNFYTITFYAERDKFSSYLPVVESVLNTILIEGNKITHKLNKSGLPLNGSPVDLAVNPVTNKLYVAIPESRQIQVIDGSTDRIIHNITIGAYPNSIALNPELNRIYVASPETDIIYVVDGNTNEIVNKIQAGPFVADLNVDTNEFGSYTTLVFVANQGNNSISIIDDVKGKVLTNIRTGTNPYGIGIDSIKNRAYVTTGTGIDVIDYVSNFSDRTANATHYDSITAGYSPTGVIVNSKTSKAYVANSATNTVSVIDTVSNDLLYEIQVGSFPNSIAFNPNNSKIYVSNTGESNVSIIDSTIEPSINPITGGSYVSIINSTIEPKMFNSTNVDSIPYDVAVNPKTNMIYFANYDSKTVSTINGTTNAKVSALTFHVYPPSAGHIECNENKIPENRFVRIQVGSECRANSNSGFLFSYWYPGVPSNSTDILQNKTFLYSISTMAASVFGGSTNNTKDVLPITSYGEYTAYFISLPPIIQVASPYLSIGALIAVILVAVVKPNLTHWSNLFTRRKKLVAETRDTNPTSTSGSGKDKIKEEEADSKKEDSNILSRADILTIDATVIIGVLIFLSFSEGFEVSEQYQINIITASIVFPFAISAIIGVTKTERFATRLMIAGFINLMISVILIAIMKL
jgi:YVTN family beta-propeller protein